MSDSSSLHGPQCHPTLPIPRLIDQDLEQVASDHGSPVPPPSEPAEDREKSPDQIIVREKSPPNRSNSRYYDEEEPRVHFSRYNTYDQDRAAAESDSDSDTLSIFQDLSPELDAILEAISDSAGAKNGIAPGIRPPAIHQTHNRSHEKLSSQKSKIIVQSVYTGEGLINGVHSASLTESTDFAEQGLFRWIHCEHSVMNFNHFQDQIIRTADLTDEEKQCIIKLLKRVPKKFEAGKKKGSTLLPTIEPTYLEESLPFNKSTSRQKNSQRKKVRFWCLPYLHLSQYAASNTTNKPPPRPMQTLLQTGFPGIQEDRDKLQASCQVLDSETPLLFHVPQLWCLALDQRLLVTCAQVPHSVLRGDRDASANGFPMVNLLQTKEQNLTTKFVHIVYEDNTVWRLPLDECKTWFALLSHFWELWLNDFKIYYLEIPVKAEDWKKLYAIAMTTGALQLTLRPGSSRTFKLDQYFAITMRRLQASSGKNKISQVEYFGRAPTRYMHIFEHLGEPGFIDEQLNRIDSLLGQKGHFKNTVHAYGTEKYRDCRLSSHADIQTLLVNDCLTIDWKDTSDPSVQKQGSNHQAISIVAIAEALFEIFFPLNAEGILVSKFWGSVYTFIETNSTSTKGTWDSNDMLKEMKLNKAVSLLKDAARDSITLIDLLGCVANADSHMVRLSTRCLQPWMHLLMCFIQLSSTVEDDAWEKSLRKYGKGMNKLTEELANGVHRQSLLSRAVVLPIDVGLLLSWQTLKDITESQPDVSEVYSRQLLQLYNEISADSSSRIYQLSLYRVEQEIRLLEKMFSEQKKVISAMAASWQNNQADPVTNRRKTTYHGDREQPRYYDEFGMQVASNDRAPYGMRNDNIKFLGDSNDTKSLMDRMSAINPGGFRQIFAQECIDHITRRQEEFTRMREHVAYLHSENDHRFTASADRRDLAIYAFSVVTVLFLPLGTVAGIFGINTNDMRNLDQDQWLFWSVAAPLSVVIIIGGLFWAGELGNAWQGIFAWFTRKQKNRRAVSGYSLQAGAFGMSNLEGIPVPGTQYPLMAGAPPPPAYDYGYEARAYRTGYEQRHPYPHPRSQWTVEERPGRRRGYDRMGYD